MSDSDKSRGVAISPDRDENDDLSELADLILAVGRLIRPPSDLTPRMCTPLESSVMRFIDRHPGSSAKAASEASLLPSSNFARVLKGLEEKGLVRREADERDARGVRLYPTALSQENRRRLQQAWSRELAGTIDDPETVATVNAALRLIEERLTARSRGR